jgi:hypothetical protein
MEMKKGNSQEKFKEDLVAQNNDEYDEISIGDQLE